MFVLSKGYEQHRANYVPKDVFANVGKLYEIPGLLHPRLLGALVVEALCSPRDVVDPTQGIEAQNYEVSWTVEDKGKSSLYGLNNRPGRPEEHCVDEQRNYVEPEDSDHSPSVDLQQKLKYIRLVLASLRY